MIKFTRVLISILLIVCFTVICGCGKNKDKDTSAYAVSNIPSGSEISETKPDHDSSNTSKDVTSSDTPSLSSEPDIDSPLSDPSNNKNIDIKNNVFYDSLVYTGYNIEKHILDGKMWVYVLSKYKRDLGWLSNITYGGGCSGYETDENGKPDIARFARGGLVCASYVTYVYFNYLPNVAGIKTSHLDRPYDPTLANSWYKAAQKWEAAGYSKKISFKASGKAGQFMRFTPDEEIPIGSLICLKDGRAGYENSTHCSHVCIYAGYKNGYNWVYHVGNSNGPEFCAIERMLFGPDPQMMLAVFTTPVKIK